MKLSIHTASVFTLALACALCSPRSAAAVSEKPNLLILHVDQWRAQSFGYAGNDEVRTPNIDRLAADSANFEYAVSGLPVCTPARASLLTGQRPLTTGLFMNDIQLSTGSLTIAEVLAGAGYNTGYIGKWHLDGQARRSFTPPGPRRQGFQYWKAINCTHHYNKSAYYANNDPTKRYWDGYDVIAQGHDAMQFMKDNSESTSAPFFLMLSWGPPHAPYGTAPDRYKELFDPAKLTLRPNVPDRLKAPALKNMAGYYAHMAAIDEMVGKIIGMLKDEGIYDNTVILFTADHGDLLGSHGHYGKQFPYDESIRVPLLIHYSGQNAIKNGTYDAMITCEDVMPTLLALCGAKIPATVEGKDFSRYLRGGENPKADAADIMCVQPFGGKSGRKAGGREYRGIRTQRYTYVRSLDGPWLLFDNQTDPYQMNNLVNDEKASKVQARLDAVLQTRLKAHGDKFLAGTAYVKKYDYPKLNESGAVPYHN